VHNRAFLCVKTLTFAFLSFFTLSCFELTFDVNMKVLDKDVRLIMDLVLLKDDFYILSSGEKTTSRS